LSIWEVRGERQNFLYSKVSSLVVAPIDSRSDDFSLQVMCWYVVALFLHHRLALTLWLTDRVAIDRGIRLADKRSLPAPNRNKWLAIRDCIYEEVQTKGYNQKEGFFAQASRFSLPRSTRAADDTSLLQQSYESIDVLDSAVLIMPLCFFISANDPRFVSTLKHIMKSRDRGGLTENNCASSCLSEELCGLADEHSSPRSGLPLRHGQSRRRHRWRR
jgi:hypothetical protein